MQRSKIIQSWIVVALIGGGFLFSLFTNDILAQEKKREKFGSSLKRLEWDKNKEAAVDKKSGKEVATKRPTATADQDVIKIETSLVTFDLLVTDQQGYAIKDLKKEDFVVTEEGAVQHIDTFSIGDDAALPRSIVLIIDHSGSQFPYLETSIDAARTLVDQLRPQDKMAIVTDDVVVMQDFTNDKKRLKVTLEGIFRRVSGPFGKLSRSQQYSALFAVLQELLTEAERPIIILQTDGDELFALQGNPEDSPKWSYKVNFGMNDLITAAQRERVTIYSVISGIRLMGFSLTEQLARTKQIMDNRSGISSPPKELSIKDRERLEKPRLTSLRWQEALAQLAAATGGWHDFLERPEQAAAIYERILVDINRRYIIGYYPTNEAKDGSLHKVHFEIRGHPEYVILGRRSYYAPSEN